jgi:hypothetical protein
VIETTGAPVPGFPVQVPIQGNADGVGDRPGVSTFPMLGPHPPPRLYEYVNSRTSRSAAQSQRLQGHAHDLRSKLTSAAHRVHV